MTPFRVSSYEEPPKPPEPSLPSFWSEFSRILGVVLYCYVAKMHDVHLHTAALGWCKHCKQPMLWQKYEWVIIEVKEWDRLHALSIVLDMDPRCKAKMEGPN